MGFMNILNTSILVACLSTAISCGKASEPTVSVPDTTVTSDSSGSSGSSGSSSSSGSGGSSAPTVTTLSFVYGDGTGICAAFEAWTPTTQNIKFPINDTQFYLFTAMGVSIVHADDSFSADVAVDSTIDQQEPPVTPPALPDCTITITNSKFVDVH